MVLFEASTVDEHGRHCTPHDFTMRLAASAFKESPFSADSMQKGRGIVQRVLGLRDDECKAAPGQTFYLEMMATARGRGPRLAVHA